jgi:hypothetical protein
LPASDKDQRRVLLRDNLLDLLLDIGTVRAPRTTGLFVEGGKEDEEVGRGGGSRGRDLGEDSLGRLRVGREEERHVELCGEAELAGVRELSEASGEDEREKKSEGGTADLVRVVR